MNLLRCSATCVEQEVAKELRMAEGKRTNPSDRDADAASISTPSIISFIAEEDGKRLDKVVRDRVPDLSRTKAQRLIDDGAVTVDGRTRKPAYQVEPGEQVVVRLPSEEPDSELQPEPIPLDVIYEDGHLLVLDKPAGLVVHPAPGHPGGTLANAVLALCPDIIEIGQPDRPGVVHRLDKETSGLIVFAKSEAALTALQQQFKRREVSKTYLALVESQVQPPEGIIEVPMGRDERHRQKMAVTRGGKYARTRYHTAERFEDYTLLEVHPYTGRTHQVRVHLAWLGYPVVGDVVYGRRRQQMLHGRHFLHAARLSLTHPDSGENLMFEAPLPPELSKLLERLRRSTVSPYQKTRRKHK
jgi:23S rRNA pseudouridine1911/1915/1917 synthase